MPPLPRLFRRITPLLPLLLAFTLPFGLSPRTASGQTTLIVTNTNDSGTGSLRQAMSTLNDGSGTPADKIHFDISGSPPYTIQLQSPLPEIVDPLVIDGTSEPDYAGAPVVEIDGSGTGDNVNGLSFASGGNGSTVRGMSIFNFNGSGTFDGGAAIAGVDDLTITGCHLGIRADGTTVAANDRGVTVQNSNQIGGTGSNAANIIAGNDLQGITFSGSSNTVQGNFIGTNPSGDDLGNGGTFTREGIGISGSNNTIGGTGASEGNVIAFNEGGGIDVTTSSATGNAIRGNQIFKNSSLGIDLAGDGRTSNDGGDGDDGPNELQNFPEIQTATLTSSGDVEVTYLVPSDPNSGGTGPSTYPLTIDFYRADADAEGGEAYLGTDTYSSSSPDDYAGCSSAPCPVSTTFPPDASVSTSDKVVATATDAVGNTSEFSPGSSKLPVELASFEATQYGGEAVQVAWTTASETNNAGFRVQHRGPTADTWQQIGFVDGEGTTTQAQSYRFTADDLAVGTHEFRLTQVDVNGTTHVHGPVRVELGMQEQLRLSSPAPNPVQGQATASFAVKKPVETTLTVYNVLGRKVRTIYRGTPTPGEPQTVRVKTEGLSSGVYFLRMQGGGQTKTRHLTVVR